MKSPFRIAYLTNHYPAVSHSFIRREIAAVEAAGASVMRWSVRKSGADLPDAADRAEAAQTHYLLGAGVATLMSATVVDAVTRPLASARGLRLALRMATFTPMSLVRHIAYFAQACYFRRACARAQIDHVHAHFGTNPAAVARLTFRLGGPRYSFTAHGPDEFDRPEALDLRGKVADAALSVAISSFGRSQLMRWSDHAHWGRIIIARCGVDAAFIDPNINLPAVPSAARLCAVARLSAQKGLPLLIDAAAMVHQRGLDFHLTLVGDGDMRGELEGMIARHGLFDKVTITGWCNAAGVREHLLAARAMILPSFAEGLPVVIMESLALCRPVIVSAIAGTPELVDQDCGWLVPAGSITQLADAIEAALAASPDQLAEMGAEGRRRVLAHHDAALNGAALLAEIRTAHGLD
ncbi:MAG: glycosyltransferase family 4 protein [Sphingomonadaceae bacterium]